MSLEQQYWHIHCPEKYTVYMDILSSFLQVVVDLNWGSGYQ